MFKVAFCPQTSTSSALEHRPTDSSQDLASDRWKWKRIYNFQSHTRAHACVRVCVCSFMHACMFNKINYLRSYLPACLTTCQPATHLHTNFILTESLASIHFAMPSAVFLRKEGVSTKEGISLKAQTSS